MSLFKLKPACKDYLWGGHKLVEKYNIDYQGEICAEAWTLSCHRDGESKIADGIFEGLTLSELIEKEGKEILGKNCMKYQDFPILIKLIDAKKALSIQVHPDDEYALKNENQYGKTEMWLVLEAEDGAFLYQGFEKEITKQEFESRIKDNTLTEVLHKEYVKPGDVIFIKPGMLHSIGEGILLAEIQQNSNVTYRIYDYGRVGADGKPRQLHIKQSVDVTRLERPEKFVPSKNHLVECEFFCVDRIEVEDNSTLEDFADETSFVSLLVTDGNGTITQGDETITIKKGDSLFIAANSGIFCLNGKLSIIKTIVP